MIIMNGRVSGTEIGLKAGLHWIGGAC
jgi:hypothetical protein